VATPLSDWSAEAEARTEELLARGQVRADTARMLWTLRRTLVELGASVGPQILQACAAAVVARVLPHVVGSPD
jgi:hypothetical protein